MDQQNVLGRIKEIVEDIKKADPRWTNITISKALGFSPNYLSDRLGGSKPITNKLVKRFHIIFKKSMTWMLTGKGEKVSKEIQGEIDIETQLDVFLRDISPEQQRVLNIYYMERLAKIFSRLSGESEKDCLQEEFRKALTALALQPEDKD